MDNGDIEQHVLRFLKKRFPLARKRNIDESSVLLESGVIDSLGMLDLVSMLENDYGIGVVDDELVRENFGTVNDLARFVRHKSDEKG